MGKTFQDLLNNGQARVLGIVSPVPMGNWLSTTQYQKLNLVRHNTATYIARTSNQNIEPGVADNWATYWMLICIDGGQVSPDGEYPEMSVGSVMHALLWGNKSYDGSSTQTITAADLGLADVYKPQGSVTFANLPATPNESNYGYVWNISDDFTTDSRFLEGAGKACPAGTNVGVIEQDGVYYYDILGAFMDLSNYAEIDGAYPTLGAGHLSRSIFVGNQNNNGWHKFATWTPSGTAAQLVSTIFLVNGVNASTIENSGHIQLDSYIGANAATAEIQNFNAMDGNINLSAFCAVVNGKNIDLYTNLQRYRSYNITIIDECDSNGNQVNEIQLSNTFYGTSAPEGAVYAVNRNVAAKVENALTIIKDGVSTVYDGSEAKTVEITENGGITVIEIPANDSGTLTSEQLQQVKNNPQNTVLRRTYSPEINEIYCFDSVNMTQGADSAYTFRNVTSMAQDSLTLQAITVGLNNGGWVYSSVQTSDGGLTVININTGIDSGTLNSDDFAKVQANPQNVVFYNDEDIYQLDSYEESTPYYQYRRIVPNAAKNGFYDNIIRIGSGGTWTYTQNTISGGGGSGGVNFKTVSVVARGQGRVSYYSYSNGSLIINTVQLTNGLDKDFVAVSGMPILISGNPGINIDNIYNADVIVLSAMVGSATNAILANATGSNPSFRIVAGTGGDN